jgi:hypothetical protein
MDLTGLIADVLPFALAAALTPTAILAGLLLLLTAKPRHAGGAYLGGWVLGLFLSATILLRLSSVPGNTEVVRDPAFRTGAVLLAGLALLVTGVLTLRARWQPTREPPWMHRVYSLTPAHAAVLGFVLAALSPKILLLTAATVAGLFLAVESAPQVIVGLCVYVVIASLPIAVPVAIVFAEGERAPQRLLAWKEWLVRNQAGVLGGGAILLGLLLVGRAWSLASGAL